MSQHTSVAPISEKSGRLLDLPYELQAAIVRHLDPNDLKAFSLVSKAIRENVKPILFETIIFRADDEQFRLFQVMSRKVRELRSTRRTPDIFAFVKEVRFEAPFIEDRDRCPHHKRFTMMNVLEMFKANTLRSFTFALGTCLPAQFLPPNTDVEEAGRSGYRWITERQNAIQSLSLITDATCREQDPSAPGLPLHELENLRSLSWKGITHQSELSAVCEYLSTQWSIVEELELDFVNWAELATEWWAHDDPDDYAFPYRVLPEETDGSFGRLCSLRKLHLSAVPLLHYWLHLPA